MGDPDSPWTEGMGRKGDAKSRVVNPLKCGSCPGGLAIRIQRQYGEHGLGPGKTSGQDQVIAEATQVHGPSTQETWDVQIRQVFGEGLFFGQQGQVEYGLVSMIIGGFNGNALTAGAVRPRQVGEGTATAQEIIDNISALIPDNP